MPPMGTPHLLVLVRLQRMLTAFNAAGRLLVQRWTVDDGAFQGPRAALVELEAACQRLDLHLQILDLDAHPRRFQDQVVEKLVIQLVERPPRADELSVDRVDSRLDVECLDQRIRIEEQLQQRPQQPPYEPDDPSMSIEEGGVLERVVRNRSRVLARSGAAELLEQIGPYAARVEEAFELDRRKLPDLFLGVVDAPLFADPRADLLHDLLDVDRVGAHVEVRHGQSRNGR